MTDTTLRAYPPGPIGDDWAATFNADRLQFLWEASRQYGDLVHFPVGKRRHLYLVTNPEIIRYVLVDHPEQFSRGLLFKRRAGRFLGTGLLTSEGEFNMRQRRLMQPAFHHRQIMTYADQMVNDTLVLTATWHSGEERDIHQEMTSLTMTIVAHTLFGGDVTEATDVIGAAIRQGIDYLNDEQLPEPTAALDTLNRCLAQIIEAQRLATTPTRNLLSLLLSAVDQAGSGGMTDEQLRDEVITLFVAGHETSANALTWACYLLSIHPEIETRLHEELQRVLQGRTPTLESLPNLPSLTMALKETLRLYSPAWNQTREVLQDVQFGEYTLPKGSTLIISPFIVHHNPRYFENPESFQPERFSPDNEKTIPRGVYFPFSAGPRVCIGQSFAMLEMQLILATILQRYRLVLRPDYEVYIDPSIALRPRGGMPMTIQARE